MFSVGEFIHPVPLPQPLSGLFLFNIGYRLKGKREQPSTDPLTLNLCKMYSLTSSTWVGKSRPKQGGEHKCAHFMRNTGSDN